MLILHRINDVVLSQSAHGIATMLKNLSGCAVMNNVMICTTMWDRVSEDEGHQFSDELCKTGAWGEMISTGAGTAKINNVCSNAKEEAERILTKFIKNAQKFAREQQLLVSGLPIIACAKARINWSYS